MSDLVAFLVAQYDRIEKRERECYTVSYPLKAPCPVCSDRPDGFESGCMGADEIRLDPCGHAVLNSQFVELYAESSPDPFVLADIESKRRIVAEYEDACDAVEALSDLPDDERGRLERASAVARRSAFGTAVAALAAPFSGEPGYKENWAI